MVRGCLLEKLRREIHCFSCKKEEIQTRGSEALLKGSLFELEQHFKWHKKNPVALSKQNDWLQMSVNVKQSRNDSLLMKQAWRVCSNRWGERWQVRKTAHAPLRRYVALSAKRPPRMKMGKEEGSGQRKRKNKISIMDTENTSWCSKHPPQGRLICSFIWLALEDSLNTALNCLVVQTVLPAVGPSLPWSMCSKPSPHH